MSAFHPLVRHTSVALLTVMLGAPGALGGIVDAPDVFGNQLTAMSGTGLMLTECQERMARLGAMLGNAGFNPMHSYLGNDAVMIARWYHPEQHATVLAIAGWQASGNAFSAIRMPGLVRWNEFIVVP